PPCTAIRRTEASPSGSSAIRSMIFAATDSVSETMVTGRSVISIGRIVATCSGLRITLPEPDFVTAAARLVEPFSSPLVMVCALLASASGSGRSRARQLVVVPHLRAVRARDPGLDGRDVVRVRAPAAASSPRPHDSVRVRRLEGPAAPDPLHDQLL